MNARFVRRLGALVAFGLALRAAYVLVAKWGMPVWGDAFVYHHQANLLADGHGFIVPTDWIFRDRLVRQSADHPPLFTLVLAAVSLAGGRSFLAHQLTGCVVGAASVLVCGLLGRAVANERAGLVAAGLAAVYPYMWMTDGLVMSESLVMLTAAASALAAYRFLARPGPARAAVLGTSVGLGALTRAELVLLVPLVVVPLAVGAGSVRDRLVRLFAAAGAAAAVVAPWVGYNLARFERPVLLSNGLGITLASANCDSTYHGPLLGFWDLNCVLAVRLDGRGDQSVEEAALRRHALRYVREHRGRLPVVVAARVGRLWGLFRPFQAVVLDTGESREPWVSRAGLVMLWGLLPAAVLGGVRLRRAGVRVLPLVALVLVATAAAVVAFGNTRYRAPAEPALVVLAAAAVAGPRAHRGRGTEAPLAFGPCP